MTTTPDTNIMAMDGIEEVGPGYACKPTHIAENERTPPGLLATTENMRECERAGVSGLIAYSPTTGEECSATSGDYWFLPADRCLVGTDDRPMYLAIVRRQVSIVDVIREEEAQRERGR